MRRCSITALLALATGVLCGLSCGALKTAPQLPMPEGAKKTAAATPSTMTLEQAFAAMPGYELGKDEMAAKAVADWAVRSQRSPQERDALAGRLAALLESGTTLECKRFACRQLMLVGSDKAVPALSSLLIDKSLSDAARYALERLPGAAADEALRAALGRAQGKARIGLIHSLAQRGDAPSEAAFIALLGDPDPETAAAAAAGLGCVGGSDGVSALRKARATAPASAHSAMDDALLSCAERFAAKEQTDSAVSIYEELRAPSRPSHVRVAAFQGVVAAQSDRGLDLATEALRGNDPALRSAAMRFVRKLPGERATAAFVECLASQTTEGQTLLIRALADRGDSRALPAIIDASRSDDPTARLAALRAVETLGDASAVLPLAQAAAGAERSASERDAARRSLGRLRGQTIDRAIENALGDRDGAVRAELARSLGIRGAVQTVPALLKLAVEDKEESVRRASIKALGALAGEQDLPALLGVVVKATSETERLEAANVATAIALRIEDENKQVKPVLDAYRRADDASARAALLMILGRIGADAGLETLRAALSDRDDEVRKAAIQALGEWPDAKPIYLLRDVAASSPNPIHRVLAIRGYARLLGLPSERPVERTVEMYEQGMNLAEQPGEKRALLAGLGETPHPRALKLAEACMADKAVEPEALTAAARIYEALSDPTIRVTASHNDGDAKAAIDGDRGTRWTSDKPQTGEEWFLIDLGSEQEVSRLSLDAGDTGNDFPRAYEVRVSNGKSHWGSPVAKGRGTGKVLNIQFAATKARYIRIAQTDSTNENFWSISELEIDGRSPAQRSTNNALDRRGWRVTASTRNEDAGKAVDDGKTTLWATGEKQREGQWLMVDLGSEMRIRKIVLDSGKSKADYPRGYEVYVSSDGRTWGAAVAKGVGDGAVTEIPLYPRSGRYVRIVQTGSSDKCWWSIADLKMFAVSESSM